MKDYASMSDFEINRAVGDIIFGGLWCCRPGTSGNESDSWYYGNADTTFNPLSPLPDYCNNPADAWPILLGNKITIAAPLPQHEYWTAEKRDTDGGLLNFYVGANPLRCAMIVFLMMKEAKND